MYLSRIALNQARRGTSKLLSSPQVMHAAVMSSFPPTAPLTTPTGGRVLWRTDIREHKAELYVVSPAQPDFTHIVEQAGWPTTDTWVTRCYTPLLDRLANGQVWHFRLTANPVRNVRTAPDKDTKPRGLKEPEQLDWLRNRAEGLGFELAKSEPHGIEDVTIQGRQGLQFKRDRAKVSLSIATFQGVLVISDAERLRHTLISGIGRAKGYGCGLITLAPVRQP
ncbi:type I-E CRISPR-associated protein Cas6/Cse3/CasE [Nocardia brasiliensis]|uniref:Type I-E CRISPR-associated protein Cas6/Cse3/CasE n=2 Tax=Nocardia brasiliensis TaxID=37326 RepID=A0A6G9Y3E3_NOCBR|nr:type I-E CRISPR-associated protein Cas6/Cse3/CasE [Nocardia brasiliensis]